MDYDVLILGGGIVGCAVAYELSKYNLNIALIEKGYDIADDIECLEKTFNLVLEPFGGRLDFWEKDNFPFDFL